MTTTQVLWGLITIFFATMFFLARTWLLKTDARIEKVEDGKTDKALCLERHGQTNDKTDALFKHKHALKSGEVIIP